MSLATGTLISDRYRLGRLIAVGGMGQVWEAEDTVLGRDVAVKVLKPELSSDAEFVDRFRAEATTTARISHPGVAAVYDYGQVRDPATGQPLSYLVMELVRGEPLSDVLARERRPARHLVLDMLEQTARALQAAHSQGLVHRDVKPGNILITPSGQVKLTDFGIAKSMGSASVTQTGMVVGTAQYIAPEQAMGHHASPAGDVYSLGVVAYECLAGRRPFVADSPVSIAMMHVGDEAPPLPDDVPPAVQDLVAYALAKDPAERYPDGDSFADAIARVRAGEQPTPPAGWLGGATTVLPTATGFAAARPGSPAPDTRAYTRLQPGAGQSAQGYGQDRPRTSRQPVVPPAAPARRSSGATAARPGGGGGGVGCLAAAVLALLAVVLVGALLLTRPDLLDRLRPGTTPAPTPTTTSSTPRPTPTSSAPEPEPSYSTPSPTRRSTQRSTSAAPTPTSEQSSVPDLSQGLSSLLSQAFPPPASGNGNGGNGGNGNGGNGNGGTGNGTGGFGGFGNGGTGGNGNGTGNGTGRGYGLPMTEVPTPGLGAVPGAGLDAGGGR